MPMRAPRAVPALLLALLLIAPAAAAEEVLELIPDQRAGWGPTNLFAPITGLFLGGPNYWYKERRIRVETTPPGATLDLFYVRANFQKAYEQAESPVTIVLPSRVEAGKRDSVTIRALLDGYRQAEVHVRVRSRQEEVRLDLEPLSNSLVALTHTYFAGRGSLTFLTEEALAFRVSKDSGGATYSVVLTETATAPEAEQTLEGVSSGLIESVRGQQLGEDLVVRVALTERAQESGVELRSRQSYDPVRGLHRFAVDLVPADGAADAVTRARAALARIEADDVSGCALDYDGALREQLEPAALARALSPRGEFTDPYLRAALKRLGELSPGGRLRLADGTVYRVDAPIELSAASSRAGEVRGYLALLRRFVAELEPPAHRRATLRGLVAPEVAPARFDTVVEVAESRERRCRSGTA